MVLKGRIARQLDPPQDLRQHIHLARIERMAVHYIARLYLDRKSKRIKVQRIEKDFHEIYVLFSG